MLNTISASVGFQGVNLQNDVRVIQNLLNSVSAAHGGPLSSLMVDGLCGPITIAAIRRFQSFHRGQASGIVEPVGYTWMALAINKSSGQRSLEFVKLDGVLGKLAPADKTSVSYFKPNYLLNPPNATQNTMTFSQRVGLFLQKLAALDKALQGNATAERGLTVFGNSSGKDSPATPLSRTGSDRWGSFDYAEFMDLMNPILDALDFASDFYGFLEKLKNAIQNGNEDEIAKAAKAAAAKAKAIKDDLVSNAFNTDKQPRKVLYTYGLWEAKNPKGGYWKMLIMNGETKFYEDHWGGASWECKNPGDVNWTVVEPMDTIYW